MRLWSLHPNYLDAKGLVALWREGLLAQKVLQGKTKGYQNHPQLLRFAATANPVGVMAFYLKIVADEATARGYKFDKGKIAKPSCKSKICVSRGQVAFEFQHLLHKLKSRNPTLYQQLLNTKRIEVHPLFKLTDGNIEAWEIINSG